MSEDNHHESVINVLTEALSVQKDTLVALNNKLDLMREDFERETRRLERELELSQPAWANLKEVNNHQEAPEAVRAITDIHPIPLAHADGVTWFAAYSPLKPKRWTRISSFLRCDPSIGNRIAEGPGKKQVRMNCILVVDKKAPPEGRFRLLKKLC